MLNMLMAGTVVCLNSCPARSTVDQKKATISGLWTIEELVPFGWTVFRRDDNGEVEQPLCFVEDDEMWQQTDPSGWARHLEVMRRRRFDRERTDEMLNGIDF